MSVTTISSVPGIGEEPEKYVVGGRETSEKAGTDLTSLRTGVRKPSAQMNGRCQPALSLKGGSPLSFQAKHGGTLGSIHLVEREPRRTDGNNIPLASGQNNMSKPEPQAKMAAGSVGQS